MKKTIIKYKENLFLTYTISRLSTLLLGIYFTYHLHSQVDTIWKYGLIILLIWISIEISLILFSKIKLISTKKELIIEKEIFYLRYYRKIISKPFEIEIVDKLESDYYIGRRKKGWFTILFYYKKGLKFYDKNGDFLYKIGINDSIDANKIFDRID